MPHNKNLTTFSPVTLATNHNAIEKIIERFLANVDIKPKSKEAYKKGLKHFLAWVTEQGIGQINREHILAYKQHLLNNYKVNTVNNYLTAVRSIYSFLEAERISPNITGGVKGAKQARGFSKDALTLEQARKVLKNLKHTNMENTRDYAIINLLIRTGLRTIEIERANIEDIRQEAGQALLYIQGKGRDDKDAFVILTEETLNPLQNYFKKRGKVKPIEPLFTSHSDRNTGGRLTTRSLRRIVKQGLRGVGIDNDRITAHSLRHTAVTLSLLGGATIQETQALARHSNINTTMIYAHNIDRIGKAPERKIDAILSM
jgi:integrase/recombinase XerD